MADRNPPQHYVEKPMFQGAHNGLLSCASRHRDGSACDWVFFGPRSKFQAAWTSHWREQHAEEVGVVYTHNDSVRLGNINVKPRERIILAR